MYARRSNLRQYLQTRLLFIVAIGSIVTLPAVAMAGSYNVQASVPYPAPTQAAVFDSSLQDTTVHDAAQTLTGTCQVTNPVTVVSIWRGASSIGSATCVSGAFSVQIMLEPGQNDLIARTANASSLYGPDSQTLTITLVLPAVTAPPATTADDDKPASPAELTQATDAGAATELQAVSTQPFSVIASGDAAVNIQIVVSGGSSPYDINLNWGDGSTEAHTVPQPGTYTYSHTYAKPTNYTVHARIRDATGAYTIFNYAVVSYKAPAGATQPHSGVPGNGTVIMPSNTNWIPLVFTAIVVGGLLFSGLGYRVGTKRAVVPVATKRRPRANATGKRKKS